MGARHPGDDKRQHGKSDWQEAKAQTAAHGLWVESVALGL
jgi:hypothetical protein